MPRKIRQDESTDERELDALGFLTKIYRKVDEIKENGNRTEMSLQFLKEQIDEKLPNLPTKQDLELSIVKHREDCRTSRQDEGNNGTGKDKNILIKVTGAIAALSGTIYLLAKALISGG